MDNFRRRILGGGKLSLSETSYTTTAARSGRTITAYIGDSPITDLSSSMFSYNGNIRGVDVYSSGNIYVDWNGNDTSNSVTSTLTLNYKGLTATFTLTLSADQATVVSEETTINKNKSYITIDTSPVPYTHNSRAITMNGTLTFLCHVVITVKTYQHYESGSSILLSNVEETYDKNFVVTELIWRYTNGSIDLNRTTVSGNNVYVRPHVIISCYSEFNYGAVVSIRNHPSGDLMFEEYGEGFILQDGGFSNPTTPMSHKDTGEYTATGSETPIFE